ncbi:MAG: hypothetical protein QF903_09415 [Planctomycetota bacterium]|jgi:hypothetical protein|nr:hypothetical protein [Planctomycetota bacterium]MDP6763818.1 hypothetical protein [Planctomycetota bacterium]MDP6989684.1 hypothetical protein [Planctomycetota bacterium]
MRAHPTRPFPFLALLLPITMAACNGIRSGEAPDAGAIVRAGFAPSVRIARLGAAGGDPEGLAGLRAAFVERNPGYDVEWAQSLDDLTPTQRTRVAFVQAGEGEGTLIAAEAGVSVTSGLTVGDIVLVRAGERLRAAGGLAALVFTVPVEPPADLPGFVRPDWDPRITDQPGGCAEETGAYRRILLTWKEEVGPFVYHALNAHRVRISDSFTHYHPVDGGFDEFYLVQMVQPGARLLTSDRVERIESPAGVSGEELEGLLHASSPSTGDLIYMPRGTIHRGLGGVLAQVITVPGFRPGAEVGVDHHLRAIAELFGLEGDPRLPYHEAASSSAVIK